MKRTVWIPYAKGISNLVLLVAAAFSGNLRAQAPAAPTGATGVVTVGFNAAVLQTTEAQRELGALQTKYAPRQAQLKALGDEIAGLQKQLDATADKLSDAERASREQTLNTKGKQFQRESDDFKSDSQSDSQQIFQTVAQKVYVFLQTYAQQHGYSVVIERGSEAAPVIWYAAGNLDITDALVKAYNAQSGSTAPASATKPGATKATPASPAKAQPSGPAPK
jgi:outer membrane protein